MKGFRLAACLVVAGSLPAADYAARLDLNSPVKIVVTSGAQDRNEIASELVVMLYSASPTSGVPEGAATIVGMNRDCLYLATANHVARDKTGQPRSLLARTRWHQGDLTPVKVLDASDAKADLAALCLPNPERVLVPFPRIPFFARGVPTQLEPGDAMTFFGEGNTIDWHSRDETMTYARAKGDTLVVRGGGILQGDSGGGLFVQEEVFTSLVGVILDTNQGETDALSIDHVAQLFRQWGLPVNLESWNFREANSVQSQENEETSLQVGLTAPPPPGDNAERIKRLAVRVSGGPSGRTTGLLVAATDLTVWVQVPWTAPRETQSLRLKFATGFEATATYVPDGTSGEKSLLTAAVPAEELVNLALAFSPGFSILPPVLTQSPLRVPVILPADLVVGTRAFIVGVDSAGAWQVTPQDLTIERQGDGKIALAGGSIDPTVVGWLAFDDRNRLIGVVSAAHDSAIDLSAIEDLEGAAALPTNAARLRKWHPLNVPIQVLAGGADSHCPTARAVGYGRNEDADDLTLAPDGLFVAGRAHTWDYTETEDFTFKLDHWPTITETRRARVPGQKGPQRLVMTTDQKHVFTIGQVLRPGDVKDGSAEPHWCGFVDEVGSTGSATLTQPTLFCGGSSHFLPETALAATDGKVIFAGGRAEKDRVVAPVAVATVGLDGSVQEIFENKESIRLGGSVRGTDGAIYIAGYGTSSASTTHPVVITKIAPDGKPVWSLTQTDAQDQFVRAITTLSDGSSIVVGYTATPKNADKPSLRIWKVSPAGALAWKRDFELGVRTEIYDATSDGEHAVIVGEVEWPDSTGNVSEDGWILAVDEDGNMAWQQTYSGKFALHRRTGRFHHILRTPGGYVVLGEVGDSGLGGTVLWLLELQPNGLPRQCKLAP